jgi:hypothetical protein
MKGNQMNQIRITENIRTFLAYTLELARRLSVGGLGEVESEEDREEIFEILKMDPETVSEYELQEKIEAASQGGMDILLERIFDRAEDLGDDRYLLNLSKGDALACISSCRAVVLSCCCSRDMVVSATKDMIGLDLTKVPADSIINKAATVAQSLEDLFACSLDHDTKREWESVRSMTASKALYEIDDQLGSSEDVS